MKKKKNKLLWIIDEASPVSDEEWERISTLIDKAPKNKIQIYGAPTKTNPWYDKRKRSINQKGDKK